MMRLTRRDEYGNADRTMNDTLKRISKYKKDEILDALEKKCVDDFVFVRMLNYLENMEYQNLTKEREEWENKEREAINAYISWKKEMCSKYGDGKTFRLADVPPDDIKRGAALERAIKIAGNETRKLNDKIYGKLARKD